MPDDPTVTTHLNGFYTVLSVATLHIEKQHSTFIPKEELCCSKYLHVQMSVLAMYSEF